MSFAFALAITGCAGAPSALDPGETEDMIEAKADGAGLALGTYEIDPSFDTYYSLTLAARKQFSLRGGCRPGPTGPHCFAITGNSGHYSLTKIGDQHFLRLYSDLEGGALLVKFEYTVSGDRILLTDTSNGQSYTATPANDVANAEGNMPE
jgi:hypothetical protein